jgi:HAD superfamily hydrolase (TIGR01509 family)
MNIVIPLCGKGERFALQYKESKPLIKVHDKEIIFYILDNIYNDSNEKKHVYIIINKNTNCTDIKNIILSKYNSVHFVDIIQETRGAAETIQLGVSKIKNTLKYPNLLVLDGDNFYTTNIFQLISLNENGIVCFNDDSVLEQYSYITKDSDNYVMDVKEKSKISNHANTGAYFFKNINEFLENSNYVINNNIMFKNEFYISAVIKYMLDKNKFKAIEIDRDTYVSLGTPALVSKYIESTYSFLFDLDGTLVISDHIYIKAWNKLLQKYNISVDDFFFKQYIQGNNDYDVVKKILPDINAIIDVESISQLKDVYFAEYFNEIIVIQDSIQFIKHVKKHGHKIAIVTNSNRTIATKVLEHIGIIDIIDLIVVGSECDKPKPYPDPYLKAMKFFNIPSNKTFIFEDSQTGLLSAKHSYPKCIIGVDYFGNNEKCMRNNGANIVIPNFSCEKLYSNIMEFNNNDNESIINNIRNCLHKSLDIKEIICNNMTLKGGYISDVVCVDVVLTNNQILNMIFKKENKTENMLSTMASNLCLYEREYYFYDSISRYVNINIPKFYGIVRNNDFEKIGILLENLNNSQYELNLDMNKQNIDVVLSYISTIASMHANFSNKILTTQFNGLFKANSKELNSQFICDYVKEKCELFINKWKFMLNNGLSEKIKKIVSKFQQIQNKLSEGCLTLCHGDFKSPNIFCRIQDNNHVPCIIDWQYISEGKGVQDIVFFMIESFDSDVIKENFNIILEYYYIKLCEFGVKNYDKKEFTRDVTYSICYFPILVALWFGTMDQEDLIDKNFPYVFVKKSLFFLENYMDENVLNEL